jgi:hypothetical protein
MKLPNRNYNGKYNGELFEACQKVAIQLTIRTGTIVQAVMQYIEPAGGWSQNFDPNAPEPEQEIVFKAMGQSYDNLKEVRRALKMKAFL